MLQRLRWRGVCGTQRFTDWGSICYRERYALHLNMSWQNMSCYITTYPINSSMRPSSHTYTSFPYTDFLLMYEYIIWLLTQKMVKLERHSRPSDRRRRERHRRAALIQYTMKSKTLMKEFKMKQEHLSLSTIWDPSHLTPSRSRSSLPFPSTFTALHRTTLLCALSLCCAVLCCAVLCCAVLCCAVLCCAVLCCTLVIAKSIFSFCW